MKISLNLYIAFIFLIQTNILFCQSLLLYDEFNENQLNTSYWGTWPEWGITYTDPPTDLYNSAETYYFQNDNGQNVIVENGILKLVLRNQSGYYDTWYYGNCGQCSPITCYPAGAYSANCSGTPGNCFCIVPKYYGYTSGQIISKLKYSYGTYEAKIKIPQNTWPAFWLYGECDEEIDIFEFLADDQVFDQTCDERDFTITIHENVSDSPCNCSKEKSEGKKGCHKQCGEKVPSLPTLPDLNLYPDYSEDFHIWTLIWTPDEITIKVDGDQKFHCNRTGTDACIRYTDAMDSTDNNCSAFHNKTLYPDHEMWVILSLGRQKPSNCIPSYPATMEVDYVKIWDIPLVCAAEPDLLLMPGFYPTNYLPNTRIAAKNTIITSGNAVPMPGQTWRAGNSIELNDGFETLDGQTWTAEIGDCIELFGRLSNPDTTHTFTKTDSALQVTASREPLPKALPEANHQQLEKTKSDLSRTDSREKDSLQTEIISITPNPSADGKFNVNCNVQGVGCMKAEISVMNIVGQVIHQKEFTHYTFPVSIDLSSQAKGTYFIKIQNAEKVFLQKVVSQ